MGTARIPCRAGEFTASSLAARGSDPLVLAALGADRFRTTAACWPRRQNRLLASAEFCMLVLLCARVRRPPKLPERSRILVPRHAWPAHRSGAERLKGVSRLRFAASIA